MRHETDPLAMRLILLNAPCGNQLGYYYRLRVGGDTVGVGHWQTLSLAYSGKELSLLGYIID
jgi:hypothetical protein